MRILVVVVQYPPDVNSTGLLMEQVVEGLVERGHEVTVFTTFPHYEKFRVTEEYRGKLFEWDERKGVDVLRLPVYARGTKSMIPRLLSYLSFNIGATLAGLLTRRSFDVVLCTNGSFFSGLTGWIVSRAKGARFVLNVQDLYPDVPVQTGQLTNGAAIAILRRLERFMYEKAGHVSVISEGFRRTLRDREVPEERVSVVPNFVDTRFIRPLPKNNPFARRHGLADRFVVSHAGNVGFAYDLGTMIEAAEVLRDHPEILFLIVGNGVARDELSERVRRKGLENVRFLPFQSREDLPWLRAASDVQVALYRSGAGHNSMPSKVYEIMASGRPLIASADPGTDLQRFVEETGCGVCLEPEKVEPLTEAVLRFRDDVAGRERMGRRGRQIVETDFSREAVVQRYDEIFRRLVNSHRGGHGNGRPRAAVKGVRR